MFQLYIFITSVYQFDSNVELCSNKWNNLREDRVSDRLAVMTKVSGEQLAGEQMHGICEGTTLEVAREIVEFYETTGVVPVLLPGGGNFVRGRDAGATTAVERAEADHDGMEGTVTNAQALTEAIREVGHKAICLVNVMPALLSPEHRVLPTYDRRIARDSVRQGVIPVVGGGNGRPYSSTDYASVVVGGETGCMRIMKGTNVDGVYDKDPRVNPDAICFDSLTFDQVITEGLNVMEPTAWVVARELEMPVTVYNMLQAGNLLKAFRGEIGTRVEAT